MKNSSSSWGSQIVKGISTASADKKQPPKTTTAKKTPLADSDSANRKKNSNNVSSTKSKRLSLLIGDRSCSTQVHPQRVLSASSSQDLFLEIDHLRKSLHQYQERELTLQAHLSQSKNHHHHHHHPRVVELEREIDKLQKRVAVLENEKANLSQQLPASHKDKERHDDRVDGGSKGIAMEVLELRRLNKELQLQKRSLSTRVSSLECQLINRDSQSDMVEKIKAEASELRHANEDLYKQVEGLQISRMNEVEELAYLRWVNSCLRDELRSFTATSPNSAQKSHNKQHDGDRAASSQKVVVHHHLINKCQPINGGDDSSTYVWDDLRSSPRRYSISGMQCSDGDIVLNRKRQSDSFVCSKERDHQRFSIELSDRSPVVVSKLSASSSHVEKKASRVPNPPPRPSSSLSRQKDDDSADEMAHPTIPPVPPIPPPPPMKSSARTKTCKVQRAPQVVEFYHSLMRRDSRKDCLSSTTTDVTNARSSMIGEIENRSSHLLAIKADVETQGEFVNYLIREVNDAVYQNIEDVVVFVKWLDDELCYLVDERAVLKHFEWPERKADTLREAAFSYKDLKKLEQEVSNYKDDLSLSCNTALKKIAALSERMEQTVHNILRTRDSLMRNFKEFRIPTDWMLDSGILSKIKFSSVKLAKIYMKRVATELQYKGVTADKDTSLDYMLLQGVRFAFQIHQFAGGFDPETMQAFEELRDLASFLNE
ncbi:hypothetical protein M569_04722, partial [Genlisea aurea]